MIKMMMIMIMMIIMMMMMIMMMMIMIYCESSCPQGFFIELRDQTKICIKASNGQYVVSEKNGGFNVGTTDPAAATQWEF